MTILYTWKIEALDCIPEEFGQTDVVILAHWRLLGTDTVVVNETPVVYTESVYGVQMVQPYVEGQAFTPYENLTQAQVISWVQDALGIQLILTYEQQIAQKIIDKISPSVIQPELPW
jgi:hypothetical protein